MNLIPLNSVKLTQQTQSFQYFNNIIKISTNVSTQLQSAFELDQNRNKFNLVKKFPNQLVHQLYIYLDSFSRTQIESMLETQFQLFTSQQMTYLNSQPNDSQLILVCDVIIGQILTVPQKQSLPPPLGFDSYAVVPSQFFIETSSQLDNIQYIIFNPSRIVPTYFLITQKIQKHLNQIKFCEICQHVFTKKIQFESYFNSNKLISTPPLQPNFASIYCQNDNIKLCTFCDQNLHQTPALQLHKRQHINDQNKFEDCEIHKSQLLYYCQSKNTWHCHECLLSINLQQQNYLNAQDMISEMSQFNAMLNVSQYVEKMRNLILQIKKCVQKSEESLISDFKKNLTQVQKIGQFQIQLILGQILGIQQLDSINQKFLKVEQNTEFTSNLQLEVFLQQKQYYQNNQLIFDNLDQFGYEFESEILEKLSENLQNIQQISNDKSKEMNNIVDNIVKYRLYGIQGISPYQKWEIYNSNDENTSQTDIFENIYQTTQLFNKSSVQVVITDRTVDSQKMDYNTTQMTVSKLSSTQQSYSKILFEKSSAESYLNSVFDDNKQPQIKQQNQPKLSSFIQDQPLKIQIDLTIPQQSTVDEQYILVNKLYKIDDKNLLLPFTPFEQYYNDSIRQVYYITCHYAKLAFGWNKLRLVQPIINQINVTYIFSQGNQNKGVLFIKSQNSVFVISSFKGGNDFIIDITRNQVTLNINVQCLQDSLQINKGIQVEVLLNERQIIYGSIIEQIVSIDWFDMLIE
ncbi:hypothetical protein SS50377_23332 [Spironucleus salmonicida]|uniref:C2H2-type domain-containing protein n=1 Tax=Spironucleus salmonicida TaxID=348837 RepID=V6LSJ7_9EUKA|nr:hypothetical protein SS50377_23332 [Spironucleus salmonicida]|eukprot:EST47203.1 Hypothetical protein SS50377_12713 [Spironucleus salmonicida]